jgi:hypothetical protein
VKRVSIGEACRYAANEASQEEVNHTDRERTDKGDQQAEIKAAAELVEEYKKRKKVAAMAAKSAKTSSGKGSSGKKKRH